MFRLYKLIKPLLKVTPLFLIKSPQSEHSPPNQDDDVEVNLTPYFETHINKIFLTSDISEFSDLKIFAFDAETLGKEVAAHLDVTLGRHITSKFQDGEIDIQVLDVVRGYRVFIIKSFENKNIDDGIMELLLAVSCMKKSGAEKVTAIVPFFPYSTTTSATSDEISEGNDFHTCFAADIIKMLYAVGCDYIITFNSLIVAPKGFAQVSTFLNIEAPYLAVPYLIRTKLENPIIVGSSTTNNYLRNVSRLKNSFKIFGFECEVGFFNNVGYIGENVKGRDVLLFNNLVRTGVTTKLHVKQLKYMGARQIYVYGFHGLCKNETFEELIQTLPIEELIMTNTIFHANENKKIRTISVAKLIAEVISIAHYEKSLTEYRKEREMLKHAYVQKIRSLNKRERFAAEDEKSREPPKEESKKGQKK